jgi:hypothetical protein
VAAVPQRAPAIAANGSNKTAATDDLMNTQPGESLVLRSASRSAAPTQTDPAAQTDPNAPTDPNATAQTAAASPASAPGTGAPVSPGQDQQGMMRSMLNAPPNPRAPGGQQPTNRMGTIMSGGIAGVASKASGHSIKLINDQDNYALWEFYFDMRKEANSAFAAAQNRGSQMGPNGTTNPANPSSNTFGSSNKGFSLSNNSSSGFSLSNNNSSSTPNNTPAQNPQPFPNR